MDAHLGHVGPDAPDTRARTHRRHEHDPAPGPAIGHQPGRARTDEGAPIATGAIGFVNIPRKATDPPKPNVPLGQIPSIFRDPGTLTRPLREEAGIRVIDAAEGVVQVEVTPELRNPAGTLQGAMVALLAEAAAEDLVATRFESPVVVTDLDLRYLRKAEVGPVRTRSTALGHRARTRPSRSSSSTRPQIRSRRWSMPRQSPSPDAWLACRRTETGRSRSLGPAPCRISAVQGGHEGSARARDWFVVPATSFD